MVMNSGEGQRRSNVSVDDLSKKAQLGTKINDTGWSGPVDFYRQVISEFGFEEILRSEIKPENQRQNHLYADGSIVLSVEKESDSIEGHEYLAVQQKDGIVLRFNTVGNNLNLSHAEFVLSHTNREELIDLIQSFGGTCTCITGKTVIAVQCTFALGFRNILEAIEDSAADIVVPRPENIAIPLLVGRRVIQSHLPFVPEHELDPQLREEILFWAMNGNIDLSQQAVKELNRIFVWDMLEDKEKLSSIIPE